MKHIPIFQDLLDSAPDEIKDLIERSKTVRQTLEYHPELWVYTHVIIVFKRAFQTQDMDLVMAAFFHDLGKVECTKPHQTRPNCWPAHGHEFVSCRLLTEYRPWVVQQGASFNNVYFIVENHMRMNIFNQMRKSKQEKLSKHPCFEKLKLFSRMDDMLNDF
jgi:hypothetical protein